MSTRRQSRSIASAGGRTAAEPSIAPRAAAETGGEHATILVVNPDDARAALLERVLGADQRLRVVTARDSTAVPDLVREHRPDLILLDVAVSDGDGAALIELLRLDGAAKRIAPLLVVAGEPTVEERNRRLAAEVQAQIARIALLDAEQVDLARSLARLDRDTSPSETAVVICEGLAESAQLEIVLVLSFLTPNLGVVMGVAGPLAGLTSMDVPLPRPRTRYLWDRAQEGPWAEQWRQRPQDSTYGAALTEAGLKSVLYVPLRDDRGVLGLLSAGTTGDLTAAQLAQRLTSLVQYGAIAQAILLPALEARRHHAGLRRAIEELVASAAFWPVFQPIVSLGDEAIVGYEALTRFGDGTQPDVRFAEAAASGLGPLLEEATIGAALAAASALPAGAWLSLNVSPELVLSGERLAALLEGSVRPISLEITEHVAIEDYPAMRSAIAALGDNVSLAIDDAGAGFASFRHILELHPHQVKLDIGLIRDVDSDTSRQALVAGMVHFARKTECTLIGEGIETQAECDALAELGVTLGQGYLFGRPESVPATVADLPRF